MTPRKLLEASLDSGTPGNVGGEHRVFENLLETTVMWALKTHLEFLRLLCDLLKMIKELSNYVSIGNGHTSVVSIISRICCQGALYFVARSNLIQKMCSPVSKNVCQLGKFFIQLLFMPPAPKKCTVTRVPRFFVRFLICWFYSKAALLFLSLIHI